MADQTLTCRDCGNSFVFTTGEQEFFQMKGLSTPTRCAACRTNRKRQKIQSEGEHGGGGDRRERQFYEVVCEECGNMTQVPFKPRGYRPVYCRDCYEGRR